MREVLGASPVFRPPSCPVYTSVYPMIGLPLDVTILSEQVVGVQTHWVKLPDKPRPCSVFCPGHVTCQRCRSGLETCWNGHLGVYSWHTKKLRCMVLGRKSWETLDRMLPESLPMLGQRVELRRAKNHASATLAVVLSDNELPCPVTRALDLYPTLQALYGEQAFPTRPLDRGDAWEEPRS